MVDHLDPTARSHNMSRIRHMANWNFAPADANRLPELLKSFGCADVIAPIDYARFSGRAVELICRTQVVNPAARKYRHRASECFKAAAESHDPYAKDQLTELAQEFLQAAQPDRTAGVCKTRGRLAVSPSRAASSPGLMEKSGMRDNGGSRGRLDGRLGAVLGALLVVALAIFVFIGGERFGKKAVNSDADLPPVATGRSTTR